MFYIYARRRGDPAKYHWNRRKNEWQADLGPGCYYPTQRGVDRIHASMVKEWRVWGRFHEVGWLRASA